MAINQTENYTHSSAELAKEQEKYICHIACGEGGAENSECWRFSVFGGVFQMAENMGNCAKSNGHQKSIKGELPLGFICLHLTLQCFNCVRIEWQTAGILILIPLLMPEILIQIRWPLIINRKLNDFEWLKY